MLVGATINLLMMGALTWWTVRLQKSLQ